MSHHLSTVKTGSGYARNTLEWHGFIHLLELIRRETGKSSREILNEMKNACVNEQQPPPKNWHAMANLLTRVKPSH